MSHAAAEFEGDSVASTPRSEYVYDESGGMQARVRFMCSFGGKIIPRPHDNQLRYAGGDTRIVAVNRHTSFVSLLGKLSKLAGSPNVSIKYQLPNEDLDALITVTTDEDVENMMEEYDRLVQVQKSARLRLFLFSNDSGSGSRASSISSILDGSVKRERWFVDALNGGPALALERGRSEVSSIVSEVPDFLFGLDASDESKLGKNKDSSPYSSTTIMPDLPPVKTKPNTSPESKETANEKTVQPPGYPGSPLWQYPAPPVQPVPVYYVQPIRAPYVHPFPIPPNQLPVAYPPVSSIGQVYRPVMGVDPEGLSQPMYHGARNSGLVQGYGAGSVAEEMHAPGIDGKPGRVSHT